jgi:hypothetical protein
MTEITYTDAPEAYDGFGTRTLAVVGLSRRGPVRKVETPREHAEWQRNPGGSGGVTGAAPGTASRVRVSRGVRTPRPLRSVKNPEE